MSLGDTRGILVCVEFSDILSVTLPHNLKVLQSVLVVTHPDDSGTIGLCNRLGVQALLTRAFYDSGALFNKFAALELGLDYLGRSGWLAILDADVVLPNRMHAWTKRVGCLYTPRRRMLRGIPLSPDGVPEIRKWRQFKHRMANEPFDGYCQIFHASDPVLGPAPWHQTHWNWCSGPDTFFQKKWNDRSKVRPPFEVLHIGEPQKNWVGRATPFADGSVHEKAEARLSTVRAMLTNRRVWQSKKGADKYEAEFIQQ